VLPAPCRLSLCACPVRPVRQPNPAGRCRLQTIAETIAAARGVSRLIISLASHHSYATVSPDDWHNWYIPTYQLLTSLIKSVAPALGESGDAALLCRSQARCLAASKAGDRDGAATIARDHCLVVALWVATVANWVLLVASRGLLSNDGVGKLIPRQRL